MKTKKYQFVVSFLFVGILNISPNIAHANQGCTPDSHNYYQDTGAAIPIQEFTMKTVGLETAFSFQAVTYIKPYEQGAWFGWNRDGGSGKTGFSNQRGLGSGGFEWLLYDQYNNLTVTPMTISGIGDVGIGTNNPQAVLDVDGDINFNGQKACSGVNGGAWRDTILVPAGWTAATCSAYASSIGLTTFQLVCLTSNGFSLGSNGGAPNPNCGW